MNDNPIMLRQPYAITLSQHTLNKHEMRVMLRIVEALQPDIRYNRSAKEVGQTIFGNKLLQLRTKDLLPIGSKNHACIHSAIRSLRQKDIKIEVTHPKKGTYTSHTGLILKGNYFHNNEFIEIELCKDLLPCFLGLAKNYSKYLLEVAFNSSSPNVMKLYQYVSHHYWNKQLSRDLTIEEIREWLQLGDKYKQSSNLRLRVLKPAIKELKEKADVYFKIVKAIPQGKQIIGWKIKIFKKATSDGDLQKANRLEQDIRFYLTEHFKLKPIDLASLEKYIQSPEWQPHIWEAMHRVAKRIDNKTVKNKRSYMIKTLINELEG